MKEASCPPRPLCTIQVSIAASEPSLSAGLAMCERCSERIFIGSDQVGQFIGLRRHGHRPMQEPADGVAKRDVLRAERRRIRNWLATQANFLQITDVWSNPEAEPGGALYERCARALIDARVAVDATDGDGTTALMRACQYGHERCARALIGAKANVNATDEEGWTALMQACDGGHEQCALALLKAKANVNASSNDGQTALIVACAFGHEQCALALLKAGADVDKADNEGFTPLMACCKDGHVEVCLV